MLTPAEISAIDAAHVWHPYSTIGAEALPPVVAVGASGAWLTLIRRRAPDRGARRDGFVVDRDPRPRPPGAGRGDHRPARDHEPRHVRRADPRTRRPAGPAAGARSRPTDWTRCSSATPARCRSRSPSRWRCSTGAAIGRRDKHRLMTWRGGYHGDTFTPMSVCDPDGGMHSLWTDVLARQVFAPAGAHATTTPPTARRSRSSWPSTPTNWPP